VSRSQRPPSPPGSLLSRIWPAGLTRDGRLLFLTQGLRSFAYGFLAVILGPYLAALGFPPATIGAVFTASLVGGALSTMAFTAVADRLGRRHVLVVASLLMAAGGIVFALVRDPLWLMAASVIGTISPSGKEVGPFLAIEQAVLAQSVPDAERTRAFAAFNVVGTLAGAGGALFAGLPALRGMPELPGYRALLVAYAIAAALLALAFAALSPQAEAPRAANVGGTAPLRRSRGIVVRLAALFALDAFAGGFVVQGLVAYWLHVRHGLDLAALAGVFFATNLLAGLSLLAAAPLARRIGLLNTMVVTHLPSNVFLLLVPLMPTGEGAVAMLLLRFLLSQLDVPTRQSYTMAVIPPEERSAAAGVTSVARTAGAAAAPVLGGALLAAPALGLPFIVAGVLKIVYDVAIFAVFRRVRPPEEAHRA